MGVGISEGADAFLETLMGRRASPVPVGGKVPLRVGLDVHIDGMVWHLDVGSSHPEYYA